MLPQCFISIITFNFLNKTKPTPQKLRRYDYKPKFSPMKSLHTFIASAIIIIAVTTGMYSQGANFQKSNGSVNYQDLNSIEENLWYYHGKRRHPSIVLSLS